MSTENQHWVPKFLIKNFADTDGRVFRLDIQSDLVTKPPPRNAASAVAFNEFDIGGKEISFEAELTKIETKAARVIRDALDSRSLPAHGSAARRKLADFLAAQSFRTEAFHQGLDPTIPRKAFGRIFAQAWRSAFIIADTLLRRHWALMEAVAENFFYLGDHPLVLQRTENPSDGHELGFDVVGVEAFLPLSPKFALYMPCESVSSRLIEGFENAVAISQGHPTTEVGRETAQRILKHSEMFASFTKGYAFPCRPENVENLNYLQCSWAHSAVYSHKQGFEFPRRVFRETPQYRETPRVTLVEIE